MSQTVVPMEPTVPQAAFSREKLDLIKQTVAKGATDLELQLFFHACQRTGLDPLMNQIHAVKRWNAKAQRETMNIQTGIDGYRLIADRTGNYAPGRDCTYQEDGPYPHSATAYVKKRTPDGTWHEVSATAYWNEYVQKKKDGTITRMWQQMPFLMLGKCAEALALRKAFPAELSGVYTHEEMMQADSPAVEVVHAKPEIGQDDKGEIDAAVPHGGKTSQEAGPANDLVKSSPFIWRIGKFKGMPITELEEDYLEWARQNMKLEDHREAAQMELDRRQAQAAFEMDAPEA